MSETQASTESTPAPEPVSTEAPSPPASEAAPDTAASDVPESGESATNPEFYIQQLMDMELDDEILSSGENYKGVNYQETLQALPEDAKKIIANLRSSYSKKTQDIASEKRLLVEQADEMAAQRKALMESEFYKNINKTADEDKAELDPYNTKTFEKRIEQEVAQRMRMMLAPMKAEHELQQRQYQLTAFKNEHPDMGDHKAEIAKTLVENKHMSLEQAYWVVKGQALVAENRKQTSELDTYKSAARAAGLKVGGSSRGKTNGVPKSVLDQNDPVAIYNWIKRNKSKS